MDPRSQRLRDEPIGKLLWRFSLPAIAGTVVTSLYTVANRAFLGNVVGADAIAGVTVTMPMSFAMMAMGMLVGVGGGALVSIRLGQQRKADAELILGNTFTLIAAISILLPATLLWALDPILQAFGATAQSLPHARVYLRILLLGSFFTHTAFGLNAIIRGEGNPRLAMLTMLINAGLNLVLDALFILVLGLGVAGAAWATVLSQSVAAVWTLLHFRSARAVLRLRLAALRPRWEVLRPSLAIGIAPCAMHLAGSLTNLVINRGLSHLGGDIGISAYGIIQAVALLALMPVVGIVQGVQPIIGFNFGASQLDRVRSALRLAIAWSTAIFTAGFLAAELFPAALIRQFADDPALVALGSRGMRICLGMMPVVAFQIVGSNFFQAIGRAKVAIVLSLLRQLIVLLPLLLLLPRFLGLDGIWLACLVSDGASAVITALVLASQLKALAVERGGGTGARSGLQGLTRTGTD